MRATILAVDDEQNLLEGLRAALFRSDYQLKVAKSPEEALEILRREPIDIVISDHLMPGMTGLEFLGLVHDRHPDVVRIMLSGHADTATAIRAINEGEIYRFLTKPCDRSELLVTLHLACEKLGLERENRRLLAIVRSNPEFYARLTGEDGRGEPAGAGVPSTQAAAPRRSVSR
jgi:two-component system probable response regulator PhcQ